MNKNKINYHYLCLILFALNTNNVFSKTLERKDFEISIGEQKKNSKSLIDLNGTITLKGTGGKENTLNADQTRVNEILNMVDSEINNKKEENKIEKNLIKEAFDKNNENVLIFKGGKKGSEKNNNEKEETSINTFYLTNKEKTHVEKPAQQIIKNNKLSYGDFAKEIIIPTNFNLLNTALKQNPSMMPTTTPDGTLPGLENFMGVIDEKELRSALRVIDRASKNSSSSNSLMKNNSNAFSDNQKESTTENNNIVQLNSIEEKWYEALKKESQIMMLSGLPMKVMLITSKDDLMYNFMLSDVAHNKKENLKYKKFDNGIFSVLGFPLLNGRKVPMCYVVFDEMIGEYSKRILEPLEQKIGKEATSAIVIGHNVGMCLDNLERNRKISKKNTWFAKETSEIGIYAGEFQNLFPRGMKSSIYHIKEREIMANNAQKQFQQRIADTFAVLWSYNRGFKKSYNAFIEVKDYLPSYSTHYTIPALIEIGKKLVYMKTNTLTLSNIWKMARENQKKVGVDKTLQDKKNYELLYKEQDSELTQVKKNASSNKLGNSIQDTSHFQQTNNMKNTFDFYETTQKTKPVKNMSETRSFELTKNNQLSDLNFNVRERLISQSKIEKEYKTVKVNGSFTEEKEENLNKIDLEKETKKIEENKKEITKPKEIKDKLRKDIIKEYKLDLNFKNNGLSFN